MERNKLAIDSESTELVFDRNGGASGWLEACYEKGRPTDEEQECYDTISMALLMQTMEESIVLEEEQEDLFEAIESGFSFGMLLLSYNFFGREESLDPNIVNHALEYLSGECVEYINSVEARYSGAQLSEEDTGAKEAHSGNELSIDGYLQFVDRHIDNICPNLTLQSEFRKGAKMAESVFIMAKQLTSYAMQVHMENQFESIVANFDSDI